MSLRARFLGVLRHRCTCLSTGERSDLADDLVRAVEAEQGRPAPQHDMSTNGVGCPACDEAVDATAAGTGGPP